MAKPHPNSNGLTPLRTRQSINWRIPIDLIERTDRYRAATGQDRTAVVVEALALFLDRVERVGRVRRAVVKRVKMGPALRRPLVRDP